MKNIIVFCLSIFFTCTICAQNNNVYNSSEKASSQSSAISKFNYFYDKPATYMGTLIDCIKFIRGNINYPTDEKKEKIEGKILVKFKVEKDGTISHPFILRGLTESCNNEAIRIVASMPKWNPASSYGNNVECYEVIPIVFKVDDKETDEEAAKILIQKKPEFPGGIKECLQFLSTNIHYPKEAQKNRIQGRVIAQFVVEKDGTISNITILRSVDTFLDKEAIRVIKSMPKWNPGIQFGEIVRVKYSLPITFKLN